MSAPAPRARKVLVTGADGFLGRGVVAALARRPDTGSVVALDVREVPPERRQPGVTYQAQDVRDKALAANGATELVECGPGKVLAGLNKRCADGVSTSNLNTPDAFAAARAALA